MDYFSSDDAIGTQAGESLAHPVENGSPERFYPYDWRIEQCLLLCMSSGSNAASRYLPGFFVYLGFPSIHSS